MTPETRGAEEVASYSFAPAAAATRPTTTPSAASERLHALDILRGLALAGMILVHFHQKMRLEVAGLEDLIGWGVYILVEQKAWGTFAFLFGVGFAVLLRRLEARGEPVVAVYLRRLAALAAFGIVAEVGFGFQILFTYAVWGVALLLVRHWSTRALLALAVLAASARSLVAALLALYASWTGATATPSARGALRAAVARAAEQGSYGELLAARWALFVAPPTWRDLLPDVNLALFILGLLAVRYGVIDDPRRHRGLVARWMAGGAIAWAASWLLLTRVPETLPVRGLAWPLRAGFGIVHDQWLCLTYVGAILLLLAHRPAWEARLRAFGAAGRLALTNYMLQAMVLDLLASHYGLGLRLRPAVYLLAATLLFAIEASLSRAWLARHRYGPLESVWRRITYAGARPPQSTVDGPFG